jgi:type I restriction enzyme S subunit
MSGIEFKRYSVYRNSGVDWLPEVPEHWDMQRLKELSSIQNSNVDKKSDENETPVQLCNYVDVYKNEFINDSLNFMHATANKTEIKRFTIKKNDVLITKDSETCDDIAIPALVTESLDGVLCGYHLAQFRTKDKIFFGAYLFRLFQSKNYGFRFVISAKGITRVGLGQSAIADSLTPVPSMLEQIAIAAYLDTKTAQIDHQIDLLNQKAVLYDKLKQSLINETVTHGLDKTVPLKDSGVEWIGEVPVHWEMERIGTAFEERSEKVNDTDYPPLSVSMGGIVPQMKSVAKTDNNDNRKRVAIGDYVINSRSDRRGASGISIYDGSVSVISIVLAPKRTFFGKYLHHLFRSYSFIEEFYRVGRGIVDDLWTTRYSVMKAIEFAYPSYDEQATIAAYIDENTVKIDSIVTTINNQIDKLKELRKTLINDVVTGKIKVVPEEQAV